MFRPNRLEDAFSSVGSAMMFSSVFTSAFHGICVIGLLASRGYSETRRELLERAFPHSPDRLLYVARLVHSRALEANGRKLIGGGKPKPGGGGGSEGGGDSDGGGGGLDSG